MTDGKQSSGGRPVIYWVATAIAALLFAIPGAALVAHVPHFSEEMARLGYPSYFLSLLGVFKVLGAVVILLPGLPRIKEWAYAGMAIDIIGAIVSHAAVGDDVTKVVIPVVIACVLTTSWVLRPSSRTLAPIGAAGSDATNTRTVERRAS
jgi:uncharacterized membrane protein YphA (DoxX/SURF4 family)